jgi:hypothetical protein
VFIDNIITDLENNGTALDTESQTWTVVGATSPYITTCNGTDLFGGYGKFGANSYITKNFTDLPEHNMIYFSVLMFRIDTWDANDKGIVYLD